MSKQHNPASFLECRQESKLGKLRDELPDQGLLAVLDSLPAPDSFTFSKARNYGHNAIKLFLGHRPKVDGSMCQAWACITSKRRDLEPPVVFYDQELSDDGTRTFQYPRSASSLLRKATDLHPPFCFLQHDPHDNAEGVRNMLCAVILYQALVSGIDAHALYWTKFDASLVQALRYIDSRAAYHQWLHDRKTFSVKPAAGISTNMSTAPEDREEVLSPVHSESRTAKESRIASSASNDDYTGGTVRSGGSNVVVKPNTSLWRLKSQMGNAKFQLLDNIPSMPMRFSSHALGAPYFPFRLQVGTHNQGSSGSFGVYAYLIHGGAKNTAMNILSHDNDGRKAWAMERLQKFDLLEPLNYLNSLKIKSNGTKPGSKARAAKIRSVIVYYFFLAENEGLIGDPRIVAGESISKRLCTACVELQEADFSNDDDSGNNENEADSDDETDIDDLIPGPSEPVNGFEEAEAELARENEREKRPSCIVTFRLQPSILKDIVKRFPLKHRKEVPDRNLGPENSQTEMQELGLEKRPVLDLPRLQLESRPSSQASHEGSRTSPANPWNETDGSFMPVVEIKALHPFISDSEPTHKVNATIDPHVVRVHHQPVTATQIDHTIATNGGRPASPLGSTKEVVGEGPLAIEKISVVAAVVHNVEKTAPVPPTSALPQQLRSNNTRNESDDESVSIGISSSSSPTSSRSHCPVIHLDGNRTSSGSIESVVSDTGAHIRADQAIAHKSGIPERTAERDMEGQPAPSIANQPDTFPNTSQIIEISDDEDSEDAALSAVQNEIEQTSEASNWIDDKSDVENLSSDSGCVKRKLILISDSDSDPNMVEEQQQTENKRKMKLSSKEHTKRLKARHAADRFSETIQLAGTNKMIAPLRLGQRWHGKDGHVEESAGFRLGQLSKAKGARTQIREEIDLTQASPSPQVQKTRSAPIVNERNVDIIEEVGHGEWRRAFRSRP